MQPATAHTVLARFDSASLAAADPSMGATHAGDRFVVTATGADGARRAYPVQYTFGVAPLQQYLVALGGGRLQVLPSAWDTRPAAAGGQRWFRVDSGPPATHGDPLHWTQAAHNWNFMCADCHATAVRKGYVAAPDSFHTTWSEIAVGCEGCHGPGSQHVAWGRYPRLLRTWVWRDPALTAPLDERRGVRWSIDPATGSGHRSVPRTTDQEVAVCAQCHARRAQIADGAVPGQPLLDHYVPSLLLPGLYAADGQQQDEVYTWGSFVQSRMYHRGVTCADCHDPHTQALRAPGNQLCARCHDAARFDTPAHHFHPVGSPASACVSCHMPARAYMQLDWRRDHSLRIPRPDLTVTLGTPNACTGCHADRDPRWADSAVRAHQDAPRSAAVPPWRPHGFQRFAAAFVDAERGRPGSDAALAALVTDPTQPAIVRASALARLARPADGGPTPRPTDADASVAAVRTVAQAAAVAVGDTSALVRRAAATALERVPPATRLPLVAPLLTDPRRAVRIEAARVLAPVMAAAPADAAGVRASFDAAADEYEGSLRFNADRVDSRLALGTLLAQRGRVREAADAFEQATRLAPRLVAGWVDLADAQRALGDDAGAVVTLRRGMAAVGTAPDGTLDAAALHHALGLALARTGDRDGAVAELGQAAALAPDDPGLTYAHAVALNSVGRGVAAIAALDRGLRRAPDDADLLFALATMHRDRGEIAGARAAAARLARANPTDPRGPALLAQLDGR